MIFQIKIITIVRISVPIIRKMSVVLTDGYISPVLNFFLNIHVRAKNDFSNKIISTVRISVPIIRKMSVVFRR